MSFKWVLNEFAIKKNQIKHNTEVQEKVLKTILEILSKSDKTLLEFVNEIISSTLSGQFASKQNCLKVSLRFVEQKNKKCLSVLQNQLINLFIRLPLYICLMSRSLYGQGFELKIQRD